MSSSTSAYTPPLKVVSNRHVVSSVLFQSTLYYNVYYSIAYFFLFCFIHRVKYLNSYDPSAYSYYNYQYYPARVMYITPLVFTLWTLIEISRLYLAYIGNLHEQTPSLAASLFLTLFPQLFIAVYMYAIQAPLLPIDRILNMIMILLLVWELLVGVWVSVKVIRYKTARFGVEWTEGEGEEEGEAEERGRGGRRGGGVERGEVIELQTTRAYGGRRSSEMYDDIGTIRSPSHSGYSPLHDPYEARPPLASAEMNSDRLRPPPLSPLRPLDSPNSARSAAAHNPFAPASPTSPVPASFTSPHDRGLSSPLPLSPFDGTSTNRFAPPSGLSTMDEEKRRRRERDRAIIRGEFDRKKGGTRGGRGMVKKSVDDILSEIQQREGSRAQLSSTLPSRLPPSSSSSIPPSRALLSSTSRFRPARLPALTPSSATLGVGGRTSGSVERGGEGGGGEDEDESQGLVQRSGGGGTGSSDTDLGRSGVVDRLAVVRPTSVEMYQRTRDVRGNVDGGRGAGSEVEAGDLVSHVETMNAEEDALRRLTPNRNRTSSRIDSRTGNEERQRLKDD